MQTLFLVVALLFPQDSRQPGSSQTPGSQPGGSTAQSPLSDGQWTIIHAEINGRKIDTQGNTVTISGNTLTCTHEGKPMAVRLAFGPNNTVVAMKSDAGSGSGATGSDRNGAGSGSGSASGSGSGSASAGAGSGQGSTGSSGAGATGGSGTTGAGQGRDMHHGVYISTNEFLCICLTPGQGPSNIIQTGATDRPGGAGSGGSGASGQGSSGSGASGSGGAGSGATGGSGAGAGSGQGSAGSSGGAGSGASSGDASSGKIVLILRKSGSGVR